MLPDGIGALYLAFEQLKEKLGKEGLFDPSHKKPLPAYPARISVITSPTGAAIRDVLTILKKRYPLAEVTVVPVLVQGSEAPADIRRAIALVNRLKRADLIITGRGGGSIEDLWAFNDEGVARAIFESNIPVISAVGHEPDVTISDFVADLRAATPSNAAELAVPDSAELRARLLNAERYFLNYMILRLTNDRQRLSLIRSKNVLAKPDGYINECRLYLDRLQQRLGSASERKVAGLRERFVRSTASLDAMSPLKVLSRGYAIAQGEDGTDLKDAGKLRRGDRLKIRFEKGGADCVIEKTEVEHG
jgi:exodeoxyribonuclease VII large subunit